MFWSPYHLCSALYAQCSSELFSNLVRTQITTHLVRPLKLSLDARCRQSHMGSRLIFSLLDGDSTS